MKNRSTLLIWITVFSLIAGSIFTPQTGRAAEPIIVGIPHSERYPYATMMKNSFEMALADINAAGGIQGRPLKLIYANDQGQREPGEKIIRELIDVSAAVMLVGGYQSSNTLYMARLANKLDRPFLVCTAADDRITQRKWENVYRLNAPARDYTKGLEDFLLKRIKPKSMAIVYENSPYGTGGAMRMMWFCREHDIEIRRIEPYHKERKQADYFKRIIAPVKENPPEIIYMVSYLNDAALLVKHIRESGIPSLLCGGAGGFTHQKFIDRAGSSADYLFTATLWTPQLNYPGTRGYYDRYIEKYAVPPDYHGAEAYSALLVAADALRRAESLQPQSIRAALNRTDMMSPFGPVKFSNYNTFERQNSLPTQVLQVIKGKFECVWPENLATSAFLTPPGYPEAD
jgi:branched-chain amino acid transport system substrate-binding protein